jgi:two-component system chemotaxis response regulator CheB
MIRCLVVDDSPTFRGVLRLALEQRPGIAVVGEAANGDEAIRMAIELRPDVVTMDVRMPGRDGIEATREIMRQAPTRVLVLSADTDLAVGLRALEAGALDVVGKPRAGPGGRFAEDTAAIRAVIESIATKAPRPFRAPARWQRDDAASRHGGPPPLVLGIGASTGGPNALYHLLAAVPSPYPVPILLTQHLADGFHARLAAWLASGTGHAVKVAEHGEALAPRGVYLAAPDRHLGVEDRRIVLSGGRPVDGFRPSVTAMFQSLAREFRSRAAGVVLTGMGCDGAAGLEAIRAAGGFTAAQGPASSVVFGMPQVALKSGAARLALELEELPAALQCLAEGRAVAPAGGP